MAPLKISITQRETPKSSSQSSHVYAIKMPQESSPQNVEADVNYDEVPHVCHNDLEVIRQCYKVWCQ